MVFPAKSIQLPIADWFAPSVDTVCVTVPCTVPDMPSVQFQVSTTFVLFQPLAFGSVRPTNKIAGKVLSILTPALVADAVLPALSVHVPDADCPTPSTLSVTGVVHESIPDKLSVPLGVTVTLVLFHPLPFAAGDATTVVSGGVLSILIPVTVAAAELPARSVQEPLAD